MTAPDFPPEVIEKAAQAWLDYEPADGEDDPLGNCMRVVLAAVADDLRAESWHGCTGDHDCPKDWRRMSDVQARVADLLADRSISYMARSHDGRPLAERDMYLTAPEAEGIAAVLAEAGLLADLDAERRGAVAALREAADEFDKYDEVTIGRVDIGSNMIPVSPADRLRARADRIEGGDRG